MFARVSIAAIVLLGSYASAYPTSVVFAPSAEVAGLSEVVVFGFGSVSYRPNLGPGASWFGINVGVLPKLEYWKDGSGFGGLEISLDGVMPWAYPGQAPYAKPMLSAKTQLLTESGLFIPSVAVGFSGFTPGHSRHSVALLYASLSRTLLIRDRSYGTLTLGGGASLNTDRNIFRGTAPFTDTPYFWLAGYESPPFGPFGFAVDAISGASEFSGVNAIFFVYPAKEQTVKIGLGAYFALERRDPATTFDGVMVLLEASMNTIEWAQQHFGKKDAPTEAAPTPVSDTAPQPAPQTTPATAPLRKPVVPPKP